MLPFRDAAGVGMLCCTQHIQNTCYIGKNVLVCNLCKDIPNLLISENIDK